MLLNDQNAIMKNVQLNNKRRNSLCFSPRISCQISAAMTFIPCVNLIQCFTHVNVTFGENQRPLWPRPPGTEADTLGNQSGGMSREWKASVTCRCPSKSHVRHSGGRGRLRVSGGARCQEILLTMREGGKKTARIYAFFRPILKR